jgi:hypothetical protein
MGSMARFRRLIRGEGLLGILKGRDGPICFYGKRPSEAALKTKMVRSSSDRSMKTATLGGQSDYRYRFQYPCTTPCPAWLVRFG